MLDQNEIIKWARLKSPYELEYSMIYPFLDGIFIAVPCRLYHGAMVFPDIKQNKALATKLRGWGYKTFFAKDLSGAYDRIITYIRATDETI